jgi:hypothetical protein
VYGIRYDVFGPGFVIILDADPEPEIGPACFHTQRLRRPV